MCSLALDVVPLIGKIIKNLFNVLKEENFFATKWYVKLYFIRQINYYLLTCYVTLCIWDKSDNCQKSNFKVRILT